MQTLIQVLATDKLFSDSPGAGMEDCTCSRCGGMIQEEELPYRVFVRSREGKPPTNEYRYCEKCWSGREYQPNKEEELLID